MAACETGVLTQTRSLPAQFANLRTSSTYQQSIVEADEDETSSDNGEPITPTSDSHPHAFVHHDGASENQPSMSTASTATDTTPKAIMTTGVVAPTQPPLQPVSSRPVNAEGGQTQPRPAPTSQPAGSTTAAASKSVAPKPGLGQRVGSFVKTRLHRTNTRPTNGQSAEASSAEPPHDDVQASAASGPSVADSQQSNDPSPSKPRRFSSWSLSARNSPNSSQSNSPPSPCSPSSTITAERQLSSNGPFPHKRVPSFPNTPAPRPRPGITWGTSFMRGGTSTPPQRPVRRRSASTEMIPKSRPKPDPDDPSVGMIGTFSKHAAEGTGLKARRLSTSLPDEFFVDHCELDEEFKSTSLLPGRRGKSVGKGATATVKLMVRKGGPSEQLYAVKEFRGKEAGEDEDEYVKKVKSEYSIAKSLHHPNIVDTVRLCTHSGRWNHVMEYCCAGELYALVEKGLFRDHFKLEDRLCLFKQLLRGVDYLHSHGIAHRDIKLENLLLTGGGQLKITDFGVSEVFSGVHPGLRAAGGRCGKDMGEVRRCKPGICGSLPYIAPEVLAKQGKPIACTASLRFPKSMPNITIRRLRPAPPRRLVLRDRLPDHDVRRLSVAGRQAGAPALRQVQKGLGRLAAAAPGRPGQGRAGRLPQVRAALHQARHARAQAAHLQDAAPRAGDAHQRARRAGD